MSKRVSIGPNIGDPVLNGRYTLLAQAKGSVGGGPVFVGSKGRCRYCRQTNRNRFRTTAHAFTEGLGNKWIVSRDECDDCNQLFSRYDDALTKAVSPFLTLGGVKGKSNKVRQTGRTGGDAVISRYDTTTGLGLSFAATNADFAEHMAVGADGVIRLKIPVADVRFKPRCAYKALVKMGFALLPEEELPNYEKLRLWLLDADDTIDFPQLEVGLSFASIGNAPPLAVGTLLRRAVPADKIPHIVFGLSIGSICFQIDLMSDHLEDHILATPTGSVRIEWTNIVGDPQSSRTLEFRYGKQMFLNWASSLNEAQPVKEMHVDFNPGTASGSITPIFR
jgi:hypothetical protein